MWHSLALFMTGLLYLTHRDLKDLELAASCFCTGILLFSGSLYLLSFTKWKIFGPVTPIGGLCLLYAWGKLA